MIPAAVATNNSTTCNTVKTTLINLTTSARAFELSIPSTVTYCCWDRCSILVIWTRNYKQKLFIINVIRLATTYPCLTVF